MGCNTALPTSFKINNNYPNPFNPTTDIRFGLPEMSNVKLYIYNIMGQKVATLVDGSLNEGYHHAVWNADSKNDNVIASGIYFCKIEAKGLVSGKSYTKINKMMLVK